MREIKFRGKRISDSEWIDGNLVTVVDVDLNVKRSFIHLRLSEVRFFQDGLTAQLCLHEVNPETVGQYTGLKDKNGKEIYESDIVQYGKEAVGVIKFGHHDTDGNDYYSSLAYGFYINIHGCADIEYSLDKDHCEVVGNIYENPELLEK